MPSHKRVILNWNWVWNVKTMNCAFMNYEKALSNGLVALSQGKGERGLREERCLYPMTMNSLSYRWAKAGKVFAWGKYEQFYVDITGRATLVMKHCWRPYYKCCRRGWHLWCFLETRQKRGSAIKFRLAIAILPFECWRQCVTPTFLFGEAVV